MHGYFNGDESRSLNGPNFSIDSKDQEGRGRGREIEEEIEIEIEIEKEREREMMIDR